MGRFCCRARLTVPPLFQVFSIMFTAHKLEWYQSGHISLGKKAIMHSSQNVKLFLTWMWKQNTRLNCSILRETQKWQFVFWLVVAPSQSGSNSSPARLPLQRPADCGLISRGGWCCTHAHTHTHTHKCGPLSSNHKDYFSSSWLISPVLSCREGRDKRKKEKQRTCVSSLSVSFSHVWTEEI